MTPPSPRGTRIGLGVVALVAAGIWLASGFYIVQEGQVAVVTQFGKYKSTSQAGFQWRLPYPIQSHEMVNVSQLRTFEVGFRGGARNKVLPEALMLTTDENIVDMQFVVQYRLRADGAPDYLFMTRDPDESVRQASETAMREVVGKQSMDFVLYEGRTAVATQVQTLMQQILDRYQTGVQVSTVAIQNVQPPEQVQAAFDDAVKAGQDRERQINEGQAYANQVVPLASGQASRMIEQAEGYKAKVVGDAQGNTSRFTSILGEYEKAPAVMRQRMYLESMQEIFTRASKVMVDTKSNNNMLYLPLDKIMHLAAQDASKSSAGSIGSSGLSSQPAQQPRSGAAPAPQPSGSSNSNTLPRDRTSR
ncbi:HflK protein [Achromobacter denitrificans]|nr:HflK protein [Achromobacter denitrificans]